MNFPHLKLQILCFAILLAFASLTVNAQDSMERWQKFDFTKSALKPADVSGLAIEDLTLMRGVVFGRHGRVFKDAAIRTYLEAQDWYKPNASFQNSILSETEN